MKSMILLVSLLSAAVTLASTSPASFSSALSWDEQMLRHSQRQSKVKAGYALLHKSMADKALQTKAHPTLRTKGTIVNTDPHGQFGVFKPNKADCLLCTLAFNVLIDVVMTPSLEHDLKYLVNDTCQQILPKSKAGQQDCEKVVGVVIHLLHDAEHYGVKNGFNTSEVVCSTVLGFCTVPCCATPNTPEQVHLTLMDGNSAVSAGTKTAMRVSWVSADQYTAGPPMVAYKATDGSDPVPTVVYGTSTTYTLTGWIGWLHTAVMTDLNPQTEYSYTVGGSGKGSTNPSDFFSATFSTFPSNLGSAERPLRVASFADMGTGGTHRQTVDRIIAQVQAGQIDMILHTGDISYADMDSFRWDRFMREMQPAVARVPYMTTPGNHEGLFNFTAYKARFPHPDTSYGGPLDAMYYTFSVGPVRFVMMDSESPWDTPRMDPVQVAWADRVMAEANSQGQFIMVGWHRPGYCSSPGHNCAADAAWIRSRIEPTLDARGVGIIHTGHVHNYERSYPVRNQIVVSHDYTNTTAPVYFVNGVPGCEEGFDKYPSGLQFQPYSAAHVDTTGFMVLTFSQLLSGGSSVTSSSLRTNGRGTVSATSIFSVNMTLVSSLNGTALDETVMTKVVPLR